MNFKKRLACILLALAIPLLLLAGCSQDPEEQEGDEPRLSHTEIEDIADMITVGYSYSDGLDENGFWEGVRALDYVQIFNYMAFEIPFEVHNVPDEIIQAEIDALLAEFPSETLITDREVAYGDTVNIDFVGSIDGIEFAGGSTEGAGTYVIAGSRDYIDDFLDQIIGHMPGDVVDVEVTFPDDYHETNLQGREALFVTTINFIVESNAELTDEFVAMNFAPFFGWTTVDEMIAEMRADMQRGSIRNFVQDFFANEVEISSIPDSLIDYQIRAMIHYYHEGALMYGMELEEFIINHVGFESLEDFIEQSYEYNMTSAAYYLVMQAIAEDAGIIVTIADVEQYFMEFEGTTDFTAYEMEFGLPFIKQVVLDHMILNMIIENAVLL